MYDENQLMDEVTDTIKTSAQSIKKLIDMINEQKDKNQIETISKTDSNFVFTGQSTDLRYFQENTEMPISLIENIPNEEIKNAVKDEFNKAALSGKITIDNKTGMITITEKGKEFINLPSFKKAAALDLNKINQAEYQSLGFALDGTVQDLGYFQYAETLDLNAILSNPDTETVGKVLENINTLKEQGFVSAEKSIVKLTDKGKDIINTSLFKAATQNSTEKAISAAGIPGKIVVVTKKVAKAVANAVTTPTISK